MCDIVNHFRVEWLSVDIKNSIAINIYLKQVATINWTTLLSSESCPFSYISHDARPFSLTLFRVNAIPGVNWRKTIISGMALSFCTREGKRFLYTDHICHFSKGDLKYSNVAG